MNATRTCTACGVTLEAVTQHYIAGRVTPMLCVPCTRPLYPEPPAPPREWTEWTDEHWADFEAQCRVEEADNRDVYPRRVYYGGRYG